MFRVKFDIKEPLLHNGVFWSFIIGPLILALTLAALICYQNDLNFWPSFTKAALDNFLTYQKIPMAISALMFPLTAIVVSQHRSALDVELIATTNAQNTFANYFKHREEFFKFLDVLEKKFNIDFEERNEIYKKLYPLNGVAYLNVISHSDKDGYMLIRNFRHQIQSVLTDLESKIKRRDKLEADPQVITGEGNSVLLMEFYSDIAKSCFTMLGFRTREKSNESNIKLLNIRLNISPEWKLAIPVKDNDPLYFYNLIRQVYSELLIFTFLSEEPDALDVVSNLAKPWIKKEYEILIEEEQRLDRHIFFQ